MLYIGLAHQRIYTIQAKNQKVVECDSTQL